MRRIRSRSGAVFWVGDELFRQLGPLLADHDVDISADASGQWVPGERYAQRADEDTRPEAVTE